MRKNAQKCLFSHLFRHFWPKKFSFKKIQLRSPLDTIKSYLDNKNQNKNYGDAREESIRTYVRIMDVRTRANLQSLPNSLGRSNKHSAWEQLSRYFAFGGPIHLCTRYSKKPAEPANHKPADLSKPATFSYPESSNYLLNQ